MSLLSLGRAPALMLLFQLAGPPAEPVHFRYQRQVKVAAGAAAQACAVLDGGLYAHAGTALNDIRLYDRKSEAVPFAILVSNPLSEGNDPARVLNLGSTGGKIGFDLEMPARSYTSVNLDLEAKDFLASAKVYGQSGSQAGTQGTLLGEFTLFDLTVQHLGRATALNVQESNFPRLHVELAVSAAPGTGLQTFVPGMVAGASVPPSREAQMLYTPVAEVTSLTPANGRSVATFRIAARVPVERVEFVLPPGYKTNFSRAVRITAQAAATADAEGLAEQAEHEQAEHEQAEQLTGEISRVELTEAGHAIHEEELAVPATLGANLQADATVTVTVEDGDDRPIPFRAVRLEMRQRKLCFAPPTEDAGIRLVYGDTSLRAPVYDYARLFRPVDGARTALLTPEEVNPAYRPRSDTRPFTERHPELLWIALLLVVGLLGVIAFRSIRRLSS